MPHTVISDDSIHSIHTYLRDFIDNLIAYLDMHISCQHQTCKSIDKLQGLNTYLL